MESNRTAKHKALAMEQKAKRCIWTVSDRDRAVLELRATGLSFKEIARQLINLSDGSRGVTQEAARAAYHIALRHVEQAEIKKKRDAEFSEITAYCQAVCEVIQRNTVLVKNLE